MKKNILLILFIGLLSTSNAQLSLVKAIGKHSHNAKIGFGTFLFYDIPVGQMNNSIVVELLDFAYFPQKNTDSNSVIGYASIKLGYKYSFSQESKTGFYLEPSAGYCRVVNSEGDGTFGDGIAVALEGGYSIEVGQRGNTINFGLKYESDMAGTNHTISSVSLRASYSFLAFRR
jgi:hypothetical protein